MDAQTHNVTQELRAAREGDEAAAHRLWAMVYDERRGIAHRELRGERRGQTLSAISAAARRLASASSAMF